MEQYPSRSAQDDSKVPHVRRGLVRRRPDIAAIYRCIGHRHKIDESGSEQRQITINHPQDLVQRVDVIFSCSVVPHARDFVFFGFVHVCSRGSSAEVIDHRAFQISLFVVVLFLGISSDFLFSFFLVENTTTCSRFQK